LDVRLLWESRASGEKGAFALRGGTLHLLALPGGRLDRLAQESSARPGFSVQAGERSLRLEARGAGAFVRGGQVDSRADLGAEPLIFRGADGVEIELRAEGLRTVAPAPADPLVGRTLGAYRILERLGSGAVGVVYKAIQAGLEREVALKVLNPKAATPLTVASFKREAVAAGRLSHPNLVQVYEIGHDQGLQFFSMELVTGGTLEQKLDQDGPLPWQDALGFARDCADALAFAQEHHLVHRDVKPENLMLTRDGRAKLADLGMAATRGMLESESAGGSPHFMAPECVGGEVDHRTDLYALGCSLYRLLTGDTAFHGENVKEILRAHRDQPVPSVRELTPDVPAEVDALVSALMAKDPDDRPADARAVSAEITELLQPRRSKLPLMALAFVALAAISIAIWLGTRPKAVAADPERVVEYVEREETPEQREQRLAMELELAFTRAMAEPEGALRRAALEEFLLANGDSAFAARAQDEIRRMEENPIETGPVADDPLAKMREELARLEQDLGGLLQRGSYGEAHARIAAAGLPAALSGPLTQRLNEAALAAMQDWETRHKTASDAGDWPAAAQVRADFAAGLQVSAGAAPPPSAWTERLTALNEGAAHAERSAREAAFARARLEAISVLQGPVLEAIRACEPERALPALDALIAGCGHAGLREALLAEREVIALAVPAAQALMSRLDGSREIAILDPTDGKRAQAIQASPAGIRLSVQIRGERMERTDPWTVYARADVFGGLLRAVVPAEVPDESVIALHLLFGAAGLAAELRQDAAPAAAHAKLRSTAAGAWVEPLPRTLHGSAPAWLSRHVNALQALSKFYAAFGLEDSYLAWQRGQALLLEFSLLSAWCSDGEATWQFQP
jgi:hypothetical protein